MLKNKLILGLTTTLPAMAVGTFTALTAPAASADQWCDGEDDGTCVFTNVVCEDGSGFEWVMVQCFSGDSICGCCP
jgi:hypothetical protein